MGCRTRTWWLIVVAAAGLNVASWARADLVRLKNGGELRGSLVKGSDKTRDPQVTLVSLSGATVTVPRTEVESVQMRSAVIEEYISRSREIPHTAEAHQALADWCVSRQLKAQRVEQLELLLELDPENEIVHRSLGHVLHDGEWMTRDDAMAKQGYVKHNGKYVTHLELEVLEKTAAVREAEQVWYPKVKLWTGWLGARDPRRVTEGLTELKAIQDPDAAAALWNFLGQHANADYRLLFIEVAGQLKGPKPVRRLSQILLSESVEPLFMSALNTIDEDQKIEVVKYCLPGLKDKSNDVVQRAAIVVGKFGDERVVPDLIDALITTHRYKLQVPDTSNTVTMGTTANGTPVLLPNGSTGYVPSQIEMLNRAGQLPYGYTVNDDKPRRMRTVTIKKDLRNVRVLDSLRGLTHEDFGYDQRDWQRWWAVRQAAS